MIDSTAKSPAKLNLFLHVVGKRSDGFHNIESIFIAIDYYDEIIVSTSRDGEISRSGDLVCNYDDDLLVKAAKKLRDYHKVFLNRDSNHTDDFGCNLFLKKNIPLGAGLGGGSSNAATTLIILKKLWNLKFSAKKLFEIALELGADVPFFLQSKPCFISGIGEKINYNINNISLPKFFVLLIPNIKVCTKDIFQSYSPSRYSQTILDKDIVGVAKFNNYWTYGRNDLEVQTCQRYPEVKKTLSLLKKTAQKFGIPPKSCRMSGTGGVVFCNVATIDEAINLEKEIVQELQNLNWTETKTKVCRRL